MPQSVPPGRHNPITTLYHYLVSYLYILYFILYLIYHHQICVLTTFPVPMGEEELGGGRGDENDPSSAVWFCPRHQVAHYNTH